MCRSGEENHCLYQKAIRAPGVGYDGGPAPYVLVPEARFLVPIGDLDPVLAAPLTDAGITTYSAIKPALPGIWPGSTAVVIGIGGLGLYAIQFLRQLTAARVVAVDRSEARLTLAREYGADDVVSSGPDAAEQIRELTRGVGAVFVMDCAGVAATLGTAVAALSWRGRLTMVGEGGGSIPFDFFKVPPGAQLTTSLNGGSIALMEVVEMAALGFLSALFRRDADEHDHNERRGKPGPCFLKGLTCVQTSNDAYPCRRRSRLPRVGEIVDPRRANVGDCLEWQKHCGCLVEAQSAKTSRRHADNRGHLSADVQGSSNGIAVGTERCSPVAVREDRDSAAAPPVVVCRKAATNGDGDPEHVEKRRAHKHHRRRFRTLLST
jgi:hypothetical protein